jgi:tRNA-2-methylthio-N6-dimethylallyladenosine synthase
VGKYLIETFGCQMNYHDAERLAGLLEADGHTPAVGAVDADVVVLNTCSVRERAEEKLYTRLGELRQLASETRRDRVIAVTGCVAQQEGDKLHARSRNIDVIAGTQAIKQVPALIRQAQASHAAAMDVHPYEDVSFPLGLVRHSDPVRAWVTIIEGCNEFCSFCVVPYTRGRERMRPVAHILSEVETAVASGRREIQLLGQIVNHYQAPDDPGCDFAELLARVASVPGLGRLRFASPHPRHVNGRLMAAFNQIPQLCRHLHMPVQSGSDRLLTAMRRRYTREAYLALVARLRAEVPGITLSTDMIVGFPGETDEDFALTLDLVRRARFHSMYSFKYSPRPNTLAFKRLPDDVPERVKTDRIVALQALQRDIQMGLFEEMVGQTYRVLVDSASRRRAWELAGRTVGNTVVNFPGGPELIGQEVDITITAAAPNSVRGELAGALC